MAGNTPDETQHEHDRDPSHPLRCAIAYLQDASIRLGARDEPGQAKATVDAARANLETVLDHETDDSEVADDE